MISDKIFIRFPRSVYVREGMIGLALFSRSLYGRCYANRFLSESENSPSFVALTFNNGWENWNMDSRINTAEDPSTSDKNLVKFGPVTSEICWRISAQDQMI